MQPLLRTLQDHDLGHLRILAEAWGFDPPAGPAPQAARMLAGAMLEPATLAEMIDSLPRICMTPGVAGSAGARRWPTSR
jgi:hypothetical protein